MAKISVIVPVYNCEKYLPDCLNSLIQQSFDELEIICVDDGSTDKSYAILQEYAKKDNRIKVHYQENQGVALARNMALKYATGEWVAFCDGDDTLPLDAYQHLYTAAKDVDLVIGDFYEIDDYGSSTLISKQGKYNQNFFYSMFKIPSIWNKMVKRELISSRNLKFVDSIVGEDVIFLAEIVIQKPSYRNVSKPVYYHWNHNKQHQKSLTHKYTLQYFQAHLYCRNELLRICWREAKMTEAYYYVYHDMLPYLFEYMFRIQDFSEKEEAFRLFKEHLKQYDWSREYDCFFCIMGMPYEEFMEASAMHFFTTTNVLNPAEAVLRRYEAGMLGFRHILLYIKAWAKYKIKRFQLEHKK